MLKIWIMRCQYIIWRGTVKIMQKLRLFHRNIVEAFRFKSSIIDNTDNARITNVNRVLPLKGLSNFWRTLEMKPINCEVTLDLNW